MFSISKFKHLIEDEKYGYRVIYDTIFSSSASALKFITRQPIGRIIDLAFADNKELEELKPRFKADQNSLTAIISYSHGPDDIQIPYNAKLLNLPGTNKTLTVDACYTNMIIRAAGIDDAELFVIKISDKDKDAELCAFRSAIGIKLSPDELIEIARAEMFFECV